MIKREKVLSEETVCTHHAKKGKVDLNILQNTITLCRDNNSRPSGNCCCVTVPQCSTVLSTSNLSEKIALLFEMLRI